MLLLKSTTSDRSVDSAPHNKARVLPQRHKSSFTFITHQGFYTQILAYMLDSLVRVSRRVNGNHFVRIAKTRMVTNPTSIPRFFNRTALLPKPNDEAGCRDLTRSRETWVPCRFLSLF